jgi:hypothetical protein
MWCGTLCFIYVLRNVVCLQCCPCCCIITHACWKHKRWPTKDRLMQLSTHASMTHHQPINTCHISTHLALAVTSSCMVKNFKIIYLTHMISILNSVFTIVFYPMRWTKLDHTCICFEEFLNQLNFLYKTWCSGKNLHRNWKSPVVIFSKYGCHMLARFIKTTYRIYKILHFKLHVSS